MNMNMNDPGINDGLELAMASSTNTTTSSSSYQKKKFRAAVHFKTTTK